MFWDVVGVVSLVVAVVLLVLTGVPSTWRDWPGLRSINMDVHLSGRLGTIALSSLLASGCLYLAFGPVSFLARKPALVGTVVFGIVTAGLILLLWKRHKGVKWGKDIHLNFWGWVVVAAAVLGLVLLPV